VLGQNNASDIVSRLLVVPHDLSLGAHVRGTVWQRIVISGGMIPAIISNDERALTILCHEFGHIKNWDKFLPGIVLYSFVNSVVYIRIFAIIGIGIGLLLLITVVYVCHRREFGADAFSVGLLDTKQPLERTLLAVMAPYTPSDFRKAPKHPLEPLPFYFDKSFFHPSIMQRYEAIRRRFPVTKISYFWCVIWVIFIFVSVFGYGTFAFTHFISPSDKVFLDNYFYDQLFRSFQYDQLAQLIPYFSIASGTLFLTALVGLMTEFAKVLFWIK
jgi:hypothetical protein